ncbi:MAG: peptidase domain-containing ABC transporter [Prevotellaceae bacterium]|jgi:ATP-binding cassette subfamily B protein|nr:peptidase domain-containing ABC transporter [Prevotellaceae bacterium]
MEIKKLNKYFVRQHDSSDCGAACLLSVINYYGGNSTIVHLREISGTTVRGTTLLGLYQAAKKMGFDAQGCEAGMESLVKHGEPIILHVVPDGKSEHYVVCFGFENGKFIIGDPAKGISRYSVEELSIIWKSRTCLVLRPDENFEYSSTIRIKKRNRVKELIKPDTGILSVSVFSGLVFALLGMVMIVFSQKLVDEILPDKNFKKLVLGLIFVTVLLAIRIFVNALRQKLLITQSKDFNNRIIDFFYYRLLALPKSFFDNRKVGDMVARLNDTRRIQNVIGTIAGNTITDILVSLVSLGLLFFYSWQIAVCALISTPVFFVIIYKHNSKIIAQQRDVMIGYAITESNFINTVTGISSIKMFNKQTKFQQLNKFLYSHFQDRIFQLGKTQIRIGILSGIAGIVILMGIITFCTVQVMYNALTIGETVAIISITGSLFPSIANLAMIFIPVNEAKVAFDRMFEITEHEQESKDEHNKKYGSANDINKMSIVNLDFRFPGRKKLLSGLNMEFNKGITGITGESGCGKSTLCQVIQRFYEPENGLLSIDNIDINEYGLETWREVLSVVPQDIFIYNGTVMDNICFGNVPEDAKEVVDFCTQYGFDRFINELPAGLMTIVGEEGINLSGGQRQLIAFARAIYKPFKVLILDEITAAMDRRTEEHLCEILKLLSKNKIIIFITHRLNTVKKLCDRIYLIENGHVSVSGTHDELMKTDNFYSDFWKTV